MQWLKRPTSPTTARPRVELFVRSDGKWAWRLRAANGQIMATDGGQGFNSHRDAVRAVSAVQRTIGTAVLSSPED